MENIKRLEIGLSPNRPFSGDTVAAIFDLLTNNCNPPDICAEALPELFHKPADAWRFADYFAEASLMQYLKECRIRGNPVDASNMKISADAARLGFETSIAIFFLARRFEEDAYRASLVPANISPHIPDIAPGTVVMSNVDGFNRILSSARKNFGSVEPYRDSRREGLIAGSSAGITLLAHRHVELVADFELDDRQTVEETLGKLLTSP